MDVLVDGVRQQRRLVEVAGWRGVEPGGQPAVVRFEAVSGENRRRRRLLLTTNTLLNAIAALATTGDSSHDIASGMAATL